MNNYKEIMIDLETLGTSAGCVVASIGAVQFNLEDTDTIEGIMGEPFSRRRFYSVIALPIQIEKGLKIDPNTMIWWMGQTDKAREIFSQTSTEPHLVLEQFNRYFSMDCEVSDRGVWGNGSSFDCSIWDAFTNAFNHRTPYNFWQHRDLRTLKFTAEQVSNKQMGRVNPLIPHHALHDAAAQVIAAQNYWKVITDVEESDHCPEHVLLAGAPVHDFTATYWKVEKIENATMGNTSPHDTQ